MSELEKELLDVLAAIGVMYKEDDDDISADQYILYDPPAALDAPSVEVDEDDPSSMAGANNIHIYSVVVYIYRRVCFCCL